MFALRSSCWSVAFGEGGEAASEHGGGGGGGGGGAGRSTTEDNERSHGGQSRGGAGGKSEHRHGGEEREGEGARGMDRPASSRPALRVCSTATAPHWMTSIWTVLPPQSLPRSQKSASQTVPDPRSEKGSARAFQTSQIWETLGNSKLRRQKNIMRTVGLDCSALGRSILSCCGYSSQSQISVSILDYQKEGKTPNF